MGEGAAGAGGSGGKITTPRPHLPSGDLISLQGTEPTGSVVSSLCGQLGPVWSDEWARCRGAWGSIPWELVECVGHLLIKHSSEPRCRERAAGGVGVTERTVQKSRNSSLWPLPEGRQGGGPSLALELSLSETWAADSPPATPRQAGREGKRLVLPRPFQPGVCVWAWECLSGPWPSGPVWIGKAPPLPSCPPKPVPCGDFTQHRRRPGALGLSRSPLFIVPLNPDTNHLFIHALLGGGICLLKPQRKPLTQAGHHGDA